VKTEGERSSGGPPKSCVKSERNQDGQEQHSTVEKPALLSKSPRDVLSIHYYYVVTYILAL